ncbi:MAG: hypothetical protein JEZ03_07695 [Bacteroidales bacterium]|nr:hypothetical protein [Bacteroidales bacterium]
MISKNKHHEKLIAFSTIIILSFAAFSQNIEFSVSAGINTPVVIYHFENPEQFQFDPINSQTGNVSYSSYIIEHESFNAKPDFNIGAFSTLTIKDNYMLEVGLQLNMVRYKRTT